MKKVVFFDLDGTLFQAHKTTKVGILKALEKLNIPINEELIVSSIGEETDCFCRIIAPYFKDQKLLADVIRFYEREEVKENGELFEGIIELLKNLISRNYELVICSNASNVYIDIVLEKTRIHEYFKSTISCANSITKSIAIKKYYDENDFELGVVVGDRFGDFEAGKHTKIPSIGAKYGYGNNLEYEQATFLVESTNEIFERIEKCRIYQEIEKRLNNKKIIGINGVDTSGKTTFSLEFSSYLNSRGFKTQILHLDDFHNEKAKRCIGDNEIDAYIKNAFDLERVANDILKPFKEKQELELSTTVLELDKDTFTKEIEIRMDKETILIFEGVLLYREPIDEFIELKVFLDIEFDEVINRVKNRDVPKYGIGFLDKYNEKYIPIQKWYLDEYKPKEKSDIVIENTNFKFPEIKSFA